MPYITTYKKAGYIAVTFISTIAILIVFSLDPIEQYPEYHEFVDQRIFFGIPNFWNVISNLPFLLVGGLGLYSIYSSKKIALINEFKIAYSLFFLGVSMVAVGSSYYHLLPSNETLVWDRLPLTISFMSLFSIVISEFTFPKLGKILLWPLIMVGAYSVYYWLITERQHAGDLRLYFLVQFLPVLVMPLMLLLFKPTFTNNKGYWLLLLAYVLAKLLEYFDAHIYNALFFISGHSIKHIAAAFGVYLLLLSYNDREKA